MQEGAPKEKTERYQLGECIGRGGLGAVYRAWDARLGRWVAIKRLTIDPAFGAEEVEEKMLREANALAALQHPNVVTVHDFGTDEEGPFVVMEFIEGYTIESCVERAPLDCGSFLMLAEQTLAGVGAAHRAGLLHRDLKPGNVMLAFTPDGSFQVKLLDFGLAKFAPTPMTQTMDQGNGLLGTVPFMAPEQFGGGVIDVRTDLYALGCVFYYTLTGQHPFDGDNAAEIMASHLQHRVIDLGALRSDVPGPVAHWVMRLLSLAPDDRPAGAFEALTILRALTRPGIAADLTAATDAGAQITIPAKRPFRRFVVGTTVVAAAVAVATYFLWPKLDPRRHAPAVTTTSPGNSVGSIRSKPIGTEPPVPRPLPAATMGVATPVPAASASPVPADSPSPPSTAILPADDVQALRARMGQIVEVRGVPVATGHAKSGTVVFLNFNPQIHEGLSLVFFVNPAASATPAAPGRVRREEDLQGFVGKELTVHGQLSDFKGDLQIVVRSLDQIRLLP